MPFFIKQSYSGAYEVTINTVKKKLKFLKWHSVHISFNKLKIVHFLDDFFTFYESINWHQITL